LGGSGGLAIQDEKMVRVLLIDGSPITQMGVRTVVETARELQLVGIVNSDDIDADGVRKIQPDVLLINLTSLLRDSLSRLADLLKPAAASALRILLIVNDWESTAAYPVSASAHGFLLIQAAPRELVAAIRLVAAGYSIMIPEHRAPRQHALVRVHEQLRNASDATRLSTLTRREIDVLYAVAQGWTNAEIARKLVLSESTIKSHVQNVLTKLELPNRASAVALAYEAGILSTGSGSSLRAVE
jgi:DNA-binding NarL/FixJ family response regulator